MGEMISTAQPQDIAEVGTTASLHGELLDKIYNRPVLLVDGTVYIGLEFERHRQLLNKLAEVGVSGISSQDGVPHVSQNLTNDQIYGCFADIEEGRIVLHGESDYITYDERRNPTSIAKERTVSSIRRALQEAESGVQVEIR